MSGPPYDNLVESIRHGAEMLTAPDAPGGWYDQADDMEAVADYLEVVETEMAVIETEVEEGGPPDPDVVVGAVEAIQMARSTCESKLKVEPPDASPNT